jgi:hypothetical protein
MYSIGEIFHYMDGEERNLDRISIRLADPHVQNKSAASCRDKYFKE